MTRTVPRLGLASIAGVWVVLQALLFASPAGATVVVEQTRAQLVERSDLVVRATVTAQRSAWNADHTQVVTLTRLRVAAYYKGAGPQELTLRQFGGTVDGLTSAVPGDGRLTQGADTVLFLRRGDGVVFLTALAQAVYRVEHTPDAAPAVRRDLHDLTFARVQNGQTLLYDPPAETPETLAHFLADVTALARGSR